MSDAKAIAAILLKLGAVSVSPREPFTWASGLKSPLYCDNRLIISTVEERRKVIKGFQVAVSQLDQKPDVIAGTATAGIPHAAWLADALSLPMIYIRGSEKKHGKQNRIEGRVPEGSKAIVIEDLVSTGGSSISAVEALQEKGIEVLAVIAIFQYGMERAAKNFATTNVPLITLSNLDALLAEAVDSGSIDDEERALVEAWRKDPAAWSDAITG